MRAILKLAGILILLIILATASLFGYLTLTEYNPADSEEIPITGTADKTPAPGDSLKLVSWNIGYGALGDNADFFMDGGTHVFTADTDRVLQNMDEIMSELKAETPDVILLQEVDLDSARSHHIDETEMVCTVFNNMQSTYSCNYRAKFVPFPWPPLRKIDSGLLTLSSYSIQSARRLQLPCPFTWPVRIANLKRCLSVNRIPLSGSDKELVVINLHLEAYDSGQGKIAQTRQLANILKAEMNSGNYVIAGGDFNQTFSGIDLSEYPAQVGMWKPGIINESELDSHLTCLMDQDTPSCRSLDKPLAGADLEKFQYYIIDGFLVSDNITVNSFGVKDLGFTASDHNPVVLDVMLNK